MIDERVSKPAARTASPSAGWTLTTCHSEKPMGAGKPVIVSDGTQNSDIPTAACLRVTPGVAEAAELFHHMVMVSAFPRIAKDIGNEAARYIRQHHSLDVVAKRYWQILCAA